MGLNPKVSVLMCTYEHPELIEKAIDSVFTQTYSDWELIAVDDNSADPKVKELFDSIKDRRFCGLKLKTTMKDREMSARYATVLNGAVSISLGEFVTFLCGDDWYYPERLERMVKKMDEGFHVVYGSQRLFHEAADTEFGMRYAQRVLEDAYEVVDLNSVMITRKAFDEVGGFPTDSSMWRNADAHLWRKLNEVGYAFIPVDNSLDPTDAKLYREDGVDARVRHGKTPW